jgi:hypothetical protein
MQSSKLRKVSEIVAGASWEGKTTVSSAETLEFLFSIVMLRQQTLEFKTWGDAAGECFSQNARHFCVLSVESVHHCLF